ncbi:helix-turn-helix transcriptional regulator [Pedobacter metabolipauper]|uniref:Regulatory LuxR family protein n=1 Tax=Pedobacter metabolipauper TaxID=425513 RepID=A0A4R6SYG8_9SPHI|nr:helix-turn-helix transcriptional regulator [Pedobacter metabolipauper]TDQ11072.1 regulatory LuxR family protein [Pedobacter metabolipauper]
MATTSIQDKIDTKIAEIALFADSLPAVVTLHDMRTGCICWMSPRGLKDIGVSLKELRALNAEEYYSRFFNEEDAKDYVPKIFGFIQRNNDDEILTFLQQVRFKATKDWNWHMSSVRILMRDDEHKPLLLIVMSFPIDSMHHMTVKASRLLEENNFLRKNFQNFDKLSDREREVLRLLALGKSSIDTASELFISQHTVEAHRKNIRQKLNSNSYYELCQYARAFDLI